MGRMLVMPSRAESLPYVMLEAAAAGLPIIATRVGGIPEIFGPRIRPSRLPPTMSARWSARSRAALDEPAESSASRSWSRRGCARSSRWRRWSTAGWPPIARRWRCENSRNSHNQFLNFIYYFGAQTAAGALSAPDAGSENACRKCPGPNPARFSTPLRRCCPPFRRCRATGARARHAAAAFARRAARRRKQPYEPAYSPIVLAGLVRLIEAALVGAGRLRGLRLLRRARRTASPGITSPPFSASRCWRCWRSRWPTSIRCRPSAATRSNTCGSPRPGRWCFSSPSAFRSSPRPATSSPAPGSAASTCSACSR